MLKGNRKKKTGEILPDIEITNFTREKIQVKFDFAETSHENEAIFEYNYVNCANNTSAIISAIIKSQYTTDEIEAIVNNYLQQHNLLKYLKFQNFRKYAKAVGNKDFVSLADAKSAIVYKVTLPFSETLSGGDYETLSDRMLKVNIDFACDVINDIATAYLGFIIDDDMAILEADVRVTIELISLFDE